jgi:hypothetical protein
MSYFIGGACTLSGIAVGVSQLWMIPLVWGLAAALWLMLPRRAGRPVRKNDQAADPASNGRV